MHKSAVVVASTLAVVLAGMLIATRPIAAQQSNAPSAKSESAPKAAFGAVRTKSRGGYRSIWFSAEMISVTEKNYTFDQTSEIDVTSLTFFSDIAPTTATRTGTVFLQWMGGPEPQVYPINFACAGPGTIHLTFNTPIQIRSGDKMTFSITSNTGTPTVATWEMSLFGTVPGAAKTNAVVAY